MEQESQWFREGEKIARQGRKRWIGWQNKMFDHLGTDEAKKLAADEVNRGINAFRRRIRLAESIVDPFL